MSKFEESRQKILKELEYSGEHPITHMVNMRMIKRELKKMENGGLHDRGKGGGEVTKTGRTGWPPKEAKTLGQLIEDNIALTTKVAELEKDVRNTYRNGYNDARKAIRDGVEKLRIKQCDWVASYRMKSICSINGNGGCCDSCIIFFKVLALLNDYARNGSACQIQPKSLDSCKLGADRTSGGLTPPSGVNKCSVETCNAIGSYPDGRCGYHTKKVLALPGLEGGK